mmetsp:Transcript_6093/g.9961  ORF Transcript_6093/g.9961 Transcript_6093/m.9961 type:complete len:582 (+) Transcript_6093:144-1889(+)
MSCDENSDSEDVTSWIFGSSYSNSQKIDIRNHSRSLLRFTYRSHFPALAPYPYTNDAGWGCMLRSAQMLIGQTMQRHYLGRDWRIPNTTSMLRADKDYCNIVRWCTDYPGPSCIYAIHHIIQCGMVYDKLPGEWYGPSTASLVLRDLTRLHRRKYHGPVEAHVTTGDTIYVTEVEKTFTAVKCEEVDPFLEDKDEDSSLQHKRRSKGKDRKNKSSHNSNGDLKQTKSGSGSGSSNRRAEANKRVISERSEESVSSSVESHCRELEDEANSFTHSVSSDSHCLSPCRSISSVSVDGDEVGDNKYNNDDVEEEHLESNPFIVNSNKNDENADALNTTSEILAGDTVFRISSEGAVLYNGLDLNLPPSDSATNEGGSDVVGDGVEKSSADLTLHDPLLNPPPVAEEAAWPASLLLLLPLRLGLDKFNPMYIPAIKEFLRHKNSVGILGGQVNRAIYFVGYRGDVLLGMDPHTVYKTPSLADPFPSAEHLEQIHRNDLHELNFNLLDPSLALAFYFHDRYEFKAFCDETKFQNEQGLKTGRIALYNVQYSPAAMQFNMDLNGMCDSDSDDICDDSDFEDEEYVFI